MILSQIDVLCDKHEGCKVTVVDISPEMEGQTRVLCLNCLEQPKTRVLVGMFDFQFMAKQYASQQEIKIKELYESGKKRLEVVLKLINTLKEETALVIKKMIQTVSDTLESLKNIYTEDLHNLEDFGNNTTLTRLKEIADTLIDKQKHDATQNKIKQKMEELCSSIKNSLRNYKEKNFKYEDQICKSLPQNEIPATILFKMDPQSEANQVNNLSIKNQIKPIPKIEQVESIISQGQNQEKGFHSQITLKKGQVDNIVPVDPNKTLQQRQFVSLIIRQDDYQNKLIPVQSIFDLQCCQILISREQLIVGGAGEKIIIFEQQQEKIVKSTVYEAHNDLVTGIAINKALNMIISGALDKQLLFWKKNQQKEWKIFIKDQQSSQITKIALTPDEKQMVVSYKENFIRFYSIDSQQQLKQVQQLNFLQNQISSFSINPNGEYLAVGFVLQLLMIYDFHQSNWCYSMKIENQGIIKQMIFTEDNELVCQYAEPANLTVYYILAVKYEKAQTIKLQESEALETIPIFKIGRALCCQFGKTIHIFNKKDSGAYEVQRQIIGNYQAACSDITGTRIILKDRDKKQLELRSIN